jgi:hypothetical protein
LSKGPDATIYVSLPDAMASVKQSHKRPEVIPNGIYLTGEQAGSGEDAPALSVGFLGNMGYGPNVKGACRLYEEVFAPLRCRARAASLTIPHLIMPAGSSCGSSRPGKPTQNAYVELFNGRFRDEYLNEHWFTSIEHARVVIENWWGNATTRDERSRWAK